MILLLAGDALVKGAVNLQSAGGYSGADRQSLTIVAFGTSAPELLIAINAVLEHKPGLALGNVVGSNTANVLLVLGVPALFAGLHTSGCRMPEDIPLHDRGDAAFHRAGRSGANLTPLRG